VKIITTDATLGELAAIMGKQGGQNPTPRLPRIAHVH